MQTPAITIAPIKGNKLGLWLTLIVSALVLAAYVAKPPYLRFTEDGLGGLLADTAFLSPWMISICAFFLLHGKWKLLTPALLTISAAGVVCDAVLNEGFLDDDDVFACSAPLKHGKEKFQNILRCGKSGDFNHCIWREFDVVPGFYTRQTIACFPNRVSVSLDEIVGTELRVRRFIPNPHIDSLHKTTWERYPDAYIDLSTAREHINGRVPVRCAKSPR